MREIVFSVIGANPTIHQGARNVRDQDLMPDKLKEILWHLVRSLSSLFDGKMDRSRSDRPEYYQD